MAASLVAAQWATRVREGQAMRHDERERRPRDQEDAVLVGEDFGLGAVRVVARARKYRAVVLWGGLLAFIAAVAGIPAVAGDAGWAKVINAAVFGGLFLLGCLLVGAGLARSPVDRRLFWYSGGLAELIHDEPEPRVVRWADVEMVTVFYYESDETAARLTGCILRASTGTKLTDLGRYRKGVLRSLVTEADRILAPRLVPLLIQAYEAGEPVTAGDARIDRAGITVDPPSGTCIPWTDIHSVTITHLTSYTDTAAPVREIRIYQRPGNVKRPRNIISTVTDLSGVPNGIFLPHLVAHAAARNGVSVDTFPRSLPGPPTAPLGPPPGGGTIEPNPAGLVHRDEPVDLVDSEPTDLVDDRTSAPAPEPAQPSQPTPTSGRRRVLGWAVIGHQRGHRRRRHWLAHRGQ